jgi:peptidoglycan/xylan/chitin deacetylase (PgdA/CDA1 family)
VTEAIGAASDWDRELGYPALPVMSAAQIREWAGRGIEFGSHGRTHRSLVSCSAEELEDELRGSRSKLESLIGCPVNAFAYPSGETDERVARATLRTYELAFGLDMGLNTLRTPLGQLRRTIVRPRDGMIDLACRAGLGWNPVDGLRRRLRLTRVSSERSSRARDT